MNELRVYNIINPPNQGETYPVRNPKHGFFLIEAMAYSQLLDDSIDSNIFGLEVWENEDGQEEWTEWYSKEGEDLDEYAQSEGWELKL